MRKNRNSFFAENNMNFQNYNPLSANVPYQTANATNSFYAGPMPMLPNSDINDISERLAKIERQINRLDHRITKLENMGIKSTDDFDSNANNMYMI